MSRAIELTWVDVLTHQAATRPHERVYTFLADGERESATLSFAELDARARAIALRLLDEAPPGTRVLLLCPPGLDYVTAFFGVLYAGMIAVTAFAPEAKLAARSLRRIRAIAADADARLALTTAELAAEVRGEARVTPELAGVRVIECDRISTERATEWQPPAIDRSTLAILQYTSGSTTAPRGVMLTHGNMLHNAEIQRRAWRIEPATVGVSWLPLYHDLGVISCLLQPTYVGFHSVHMPPAAFVQRPSRWLGAISRYRGTFAGGPNFAFDLCARKVSDEERAGLDLGSWRTAFSGAEPVRAETLDRFAGRFAACGFRRQAFYPCYGLAEANFVTGPLDGDAVVRRFDVAALAAHEARPTPDEDEDTTRARRLVGCGRLQPGQDVRIVDPESRAERDPGRVGEIWIGGDSVGTGYWGRRAESDLIFGAAVAGGDGRRYLRSGDLGFFDDDGELFVTGRIKDVIIIRGANLYPHDIELTVERAHPSLRPGCGAAFAVDAPDGEILAVVQEALVDGPVAHELFARICAAVAEEHGVEVGAIALVRPGSIHKTTSGKIQRSACRAAFSRGELDLVAAWSRSAPASAAAPAVPAAPSRGEIERWLVDELARRSGRPAPQIDVHAPFGELGLGSLDAVQVSGAIADWLGRPVAPTVLYSHASIARLARHLAGGSDGAPAPRQPVAGDEPIAIVAASCRFPGGVRSPEALWQLLCDGTDAISAFPDDRGWDEQASYCREGGFLYDAAELDAAFFGISPREALTTDPQQRLLLETAWEALERAGIDPSSLSGTATGVYVGAMSSDYGARLLMTPEALEGHVAIGSAGSVASGRIAYTLGLEGPAITVDTACSSSLVALHLACQSLRRGECSLALVGGATVMATPTSFTEFSRQRGLARDGRCKPFSARADGVGWAEGAGMLVLARLSEAQRLGRPILALIRGSAVNQDGRSHALTAPNGGAQERVIEAALADAGLSAADVDAVEAHGTGTALGDPIEAGALLATYGRAHSPERPLLLGSIKSNLGHTQAAAGVAGVLKMVLALQHEELPPTLHVQTPSPQVDWSTRRMQLLARAVPWLSGARPRRAGVSSFGISGTNAHVILEEAPAPAPGAQQPMPSLPLFVSGRDEAGVRAQAAQLRDHLVAHPDLPLEDVAFTLATGRAWLERRAAITALGHDAALAALDALADGRESSDVERGEARAVARTVLVLGGAPERVDGSWHEGSRAFRDGLGACERALGPHARSAAGMRFSRLVSLAAAWGAAGVEPDVFVVAAGDELAAACVAGIVGVRDAARILTAGCDESERRTLAEALRSRVIETPSSDDDVIALDSAIDWQGFVALLARRHLHGRAVAWRDILPLRRPTSLPTYAFARQRYWLDAPVPARAAAPAGVRAESHPLVTASIPVADSGAHLFTGELAIAAQPWLADHRVAGAPVVPAAVFLEVAATLAERSGLCCVEELTLEAPLGLDGPRQLQVLLDGPDGDGRRAIRFFARGDDGAPWTRHATGLLGKTPAPAAPDLTQWPPPRAQPLSLDALYDRLAADGLTYGRGFRGLHAAWQRGDELFAELALPDALAPEAGGFTTHPVLLDSALHALALLPSRPTGLPFALAGARLRRTESQSLRVRVTVGAGGFALALADAAGQPVGHIESLRLRPAAPATQLPAPLFTVEWRAESGAPVTTPARWALLGHTPAGWPEPLQSAGVSISTAADVPALDAHAELPDAILVPLVDPVDADSARAARATARQLLGIVQAYLQRDRLAATPLVVVTRRAVATGHQDPPTDIARAAAWGLLRAAQAEHPDRPLVLVDVDDELPFSLVRAALLWSEPQLALRHGRLLVPRLVAAARSEAPPFDRDGTLLVTGGTGGLGAHLARHLVTRHGARHLVLVSRQGAAAPGATELARELAADGAQVTLAACDVADRAALARLLDGIPAAHRLTGVIHTAGLLDDGVLTAMQPAQVDRVFAPKVDGALNLHELTCDRALSLFVLFSSLSGVLGTAGQASYAAANALLDALAQHRRSRGLPATAIAWGPWDSTGMTAQLGAADRARMARLGIRALTTEEGLAAFDAAVGHAAPVVVAASLALDPQADDESPPSMLHELAQRSRRPTVDGRGGDPPLRERLLELPERERHGMLVDIVRRDAALVLGGAPDAVEPQRPLVELGLDSLMAVELRNRLSVTTGLRLPATLLFDHPTPTAVARALLPRLCPPPPPRVPTADDEPASAIDAMEVDELVALALGNGGAR